MEVIDAFQSHAELMQDKKKGKAIKFDCSVKRMKRVLGNTLTVVSLSVERKRLITKSRGKKEESMESME